MHTQKTQVLTNGINDLNDNRRDTLKHFKEKLNEDKKVKLAKKQKRKENRTEYKWQSRKGSKKVKKSNVKMCSAGKAQKAIGGICTKDKAGDTTASKRKREACKDSTIKTGDSLTLKDGTSRKVISPNEHVKYLGKQFNLINNIDKDIDDRIRKGWIKFDKV